MMPVIGKGNQINTNCYIEISLSNIHLPAKSKAKDWILKIKIIVIVFVVDLMASIIWIRLV